MASARIDQKCTFFNYNQTLCLSFANRTFVEKEREATERKSPKQASVIPGIQRREDTVVLCVPPIVSSCSLVYQSVVAVFLFSSCMEMECFVCVLCSALLLTRFRSLRK
jgi:hypothetical protein